MCKLRVPAGSQVTAGRPPVYHSSIMSGKSQGRVVELVLLSKAVLSSRGAKKKIASFFGRTRHFLLFSSIISCLAVSDPNWKLTNRFNVQSYCESQQRVFFFLPLHQYVALYLFPVDWQHQRLYLEAERQRGRYTGRESCVVIIGAKGLQRWRRSNLFAAPAPPQTKAGTVWVVIILGSV